MQIINYSNHSRKMQPAFKSYEFRNFKALAQQLTEKEAEVLLKDIDKFIIRNGKNSNYDMILQYHPKSDAISMKTKDIKRGNTLTQAYKVVEKGRDYIDNIIQHLQYESQSFRIGVTDLLPKGSHIEDVVSIADGNLQKVKINELA